MKQGTSGTYGNESLPNITGSHITSWAGSDGQSTVTGCFEKGNLSSYKVTPSTSGSSPAFIVNMNASRSSSTYKDNAKVNPDNAEIMYCIKY